MEFLDEETRPRFLFQSRSSPPSIPDHHQPSDRLLKPSLFLSLSLSVSLLSLSLFFTQSEPLKSLLFWFSLSLLLGPFAPSALTAGDIRVGLGKILADPVRDSAEVDKPGRRSRNRRSEENPVHESARFGEKASALENSRKFEENPVVGSGRLGKKASNLVNSRKFEENPDVGSARLGKKATNLADSGKIEENPDSGSGRLGKKEREWSEGDLEMLKKLLSKHPVGKPRRWEAISEAFDGAHGVESVIRAAKSLGVKKMDDSDSFARFLKDRKPLDRRAEEAGTEEEREREWSGGDDVALLNALKAFPKETGMRWEKIAAAVPGKTKAECVKRVAELKKGFRSSKGSNES